HEYTPLWVKQIPTDRPGKKIEIRNTTGNAKITLAKSNRLVATVSLIRNGIVRINTIYYPGWSVMIDGKIQNITYNNLQGVMDVKVPQGSHTLNASFSDNTGVRLIADYVS